MKNGFLLNFQKANVRHSNPLFFEVRVRKSMSLMRLYYIDDRQYRFWASWEITRNRISIRPNCISRMFFLKISDLFLLFFCLKPPGRMQRVPGLLRLFWAVSRMVLMTIQVLTFAPICSKWARFGMPFAKIMRDQHEKTYVRLANFISKSACSLDDQWRQSPPG